MILDQSQSLSLAQSNNAAAGTNLTVALRTLRNPAKTAHFTVFSDGPAPSSVNLDDYIPPEELSLLFPRS